MKMETLGTLIDKLTISNLKIWHAEDRRNDHSLLDAERLKAADQVTVCNRQRNELVAEIDEFFAAALRGERKLTQGYVRIDPPKAGAR
jgi:hypothetical protein